MDGMGKHAPCASGLLAKCYLRRVATLHVRNVPEDVYEALRKRAEREGRSISAATVAILRRSLPAAFDPEAFIAEVDADIERWSWPDDGPTPEEIIRRDRDSR
jgi:plasmid stability protein